MPSYLHAAWPRKALPKPCLFTLAPVVCMYRCLAREPRAANPRPSREPQPSQPHAQPPNNSASSHDPPAPPLSAPRAPQANRMQIMKWLAANVIDPNDPRNAPLLELLKTHEANTGALGDLFRLDIFPDVAMRVGAACGRPAPLPASALMQRLACIACRHT